LRDDEWRVRASKRATDYYLFTSVPLGKPLQMNSTSTPKAGAGEVDDDYPAGELQTLLGDINSQATTVSHKLTQTTMRLRQAESEILHLDKRE
jgi:hypothetical protein